MTDVHDAAHTGAPPTGEPAQFSETHGEGM